MVASGFNRDEVLPALARLGILGQMASWSERNCRSSTDQVNCRYDNPAPGVGACPINLMFGGRA